MNRPACLALLLILCMGLIPLAQAGVLTPHLLPLQGYATDTSGLALPRADIVVRIYEVSTGDDPLYDSGAEFAGAVGSGFVDLVLGAGVPLMLDNTQLYHMEVFLDGVEMIGENTGGRWAFYPGTGSHDRSDLEARLDVLEAAVGVPKSASAGGESRTNPLTSPMVKLTKFGATGSTARLEYGMLGVGHVEGATGSTQVSGVMLLQPGGIFTSGDRVLKLGPLHVPLPEYITGVDEPGMPLRTRLLGCYPNPFNPRTSIHFELAKQSVVGIRIYDLAGRLVHTLVTDEHFDAGGHELVWNGRDDAGRGVASGTYFYRFEAGETVFTRSMTLLK